jgi:histidinol-phosphate aminotransferase
MIFFCSPNNPSANVMNQSAVKEILQSFKGIVIIDEAYIDFSDKGSWLSEINNYPNLVVLQTFSKAWGMAGLRLGMMFAHPSVIELMNRTKPPYNVNECTQKFALSALDNNSYHEQMILILKSEKENLRVSLSGLDSVEKIYPSDANFLLVRFRDAKKMYEDLMDRGVIVRDRSTQLHCDNCLRITVGKKEENEKLIQTIKEVENL